MLLLVLLVSSFALGQDNSKQWARQQTIPPEVQEAFKKSGFDSIYVFTFHVNPFYLRGDFNGDRVSDYAALINRKSDGKIGIALVHGSGRIVVCGAGKHIGNGGDDFKWLDAWHVYPKGQTQQGVPELPPPTLKGDALAVQKLGAASGLIYWTGKKYEWYQQGD
ncbi:MAG: hypothetical protein ACKVRP_08225 [Bacteroidota bacterium]